MKEAPGFDMDFENAERIGFLIASFLKGTLTRLERSELDQWILASQKNELLFDELTSPENIQKTIEWYKSLDEEKARRKIASRISFKKPRRKIFSLSFVAVAASIILLAGIAGFYFFSKKQLADHSAQRVATTKDVLPGRDKAVLTLAGGKKIVLDSTAPASIESGKIRIGTGSISYQALASEVPTENLLTVPRGGQYKVILSDGTTVWLNAESSLQYPTAFSGTERRVVLRGEGYFEVTKNKEKPFIVESSGNTIKVLGTHFNVNSYGDQNVFTTTLLEGSIQLSSGGDSKILKPGEQAEVSRNNIDVHTVDPMGAIAWKNGVFLFRNTPVHSIVNQLARWYDLDVEYAEPVDRHLNASIGRNVPLSKVLHYLEETGDIHFKLEGKKLIVMK